MLGLIFFLVVVIIGCIFYVAKNTPEEATVPFPLSVPTILVGMIVSTAFILDYLQFSNLNTISIGSVIAVFLVIAISLILQIINDQKVSLVIVGLVAMSCSTAATFLAIYDNLTAGLVTFAGVSIVLVFIDMFILTIGNLKSAKSR